MSQNESIFAGVNDTSRSLGKSDPYESSRYRNYVLGVLTLVYCTNFVDRQLLSILQESIKQELLLSDTQLGLLTGFTFAIFYVLAGIPIAHMADRSVRRNIISGSIAIWSLMTAVSGAAMNLLQLSLARIGVGIGEAGCTPPAHSMISDIFPASQRATALSIYSIGINIGVLLGFLLGGWLNEFYGWRIAFVVVGLPGIAVALLMRFTVAEPTRGFSENARSDDQTSHSVKEVISLLWSYPSFRHLSMACGLSAFIVYASINWMAPFMIRTHGIGTGELGTWLALSTGVGGAIGTFAGGYLTDRFGKRDQRWYMWLPAFATLLSVPLLAMTFLADDVYSALLFNIVPAIVSMCYLGPCLAMTHGLVGLKMRAVASSIVLLVINVIGLGIGPWAIGALSDALLNDYGVDSLRYALLSILPVVGVWCAMHFFLAAKSLREGLAKAPN